MGWIKVNRRLLENPISNKPAYISLWIHLLLMANHQESSFIWNNKKEVLKKGQLLTGIKVLAKKTGIAEGTVYRILKYLENEKQIEQQKTTKFTVITIVNWCKYQENEEQNAKQIKNRLKTDRKQNKTYKNDKNEENDENDIPKGIGESVQRGNSDINECVSYLQNKLGTSLDGTVKENRQYCYNLLRKMRKDYPESSPVDNVKLLIETALRDKFHSRNSTGFKYLYYNTQKISASFKKNKGNSVAVIS